MSIANILLNGKINPEYIPGGGGGPFPNPVVFEDGITVDGGIGVPTGDLALLVGSLTVQVGGIGVGGEINCNGGINVNGGNITALGVNIVASDTAGCIVTMGTNNTNEVAFVDLVGENIGPSFRLAVGGNLPVAPYTTNQFGIYTAGDGVTFEERLSIDLSGAVVIPGSLTVNGREIGNTTLIQLTNVVGNSITVGTQATLSITSNVLYLANHTYRVSINMEVDNNDQNPGFSTNISVGGDYAMGSQNTNLFSQSSIYSCIFRPLVNRTDSVIATNTSLTDQSFLQFSPDSLFVLVEDLGIL